MKNCLALSANAFATHEIINLSGKVEGKQNCKLLHGPKRCRKLFRSFSHPANEKHFNLRQTVDLLVDFSRREREREVNMKLCIEIHKLSSCCYRYPRILKIYRRLFVSVSQKASLLIHQHSNPFNLIYGL